MKKKSVWVVGNNFSVQTLFQKRGWEIVHDSNSQKTSPDLVCFTGGEDVNPTLYGEKLHTRTYPNAPRDAKEMLVYEKYLKTPKVGICRGGQLLNVLNGGALWQHVNNHGTHHEMIDLLFTRTKLRVTSSHHQMMIPAEHNSYVLAAAENIATKYETLLPEGRQTPKYDPEVVWYPKTFSMCYQSHPEYISSVVGNDHVDYFFDLINWAFD